MVAYLVIGIIFLVLGLGLRYWINRRKFYRRSPTGAEGFSSYEKSVAIKFGERLGKWIAYALIIFWVSVVMGVFKHFYKTQTNY